MKISLSGKGGTGKSVSTTLLALAFSEKGFDVLVVDSDESNPGLYRNFGIKNPPRPLIDQFGDRRPEGEEKESPVTLAGIGSEYLASAGRVQFATVGKITTSLQGCACPISKAAANFLTRLELGPNEVALVDMEAGVEHFGRGVEQGIDIVLAIVEPSFESLALGAKVVMMARSAGLKRAWAVLNKVPSRQIEARLKEELLERDVQTIGALRYDPAIFETSLSGNPLAGSVSLSDARAVVETLVSRWSQPK